MLTAFTTCSSKSSAEVDLSCVFYSSHLIRYPLSRMGYCKTFVISVLPMLSHYQGIVYFLCSPADLSWCASARTNVFSVGSRSCMWCNGRIYKWLLNAHSEVKFLNYIDASAAYSISRGAPRFISNTSTLYLSLSIFHKAVVTQIYYLIDCRSL